MSPTELAPWFGGLGSLLAIAYTAWSSKSRATTTQLNNKADSQTVALVAGKLDLLEDRVTRVETRMEQMPNVHDSHELQVAVATLNGKIETLTERIKPIAAMADRVKEVLIEKLNA